MEKFNLAVSRFYRKKYDDCIKICDEILKDSPEDFSSQLLKTHCIRRKNYVDHLESDESTIGDLILDDHSISTLPRPGTSLRVIGTGQGGNRPITSSGRPMTGVVRPGTMSRVGTSSGNIVRAGTGNTLTRATTSGGRYLRAATASLQSINSSMSLNTKAINPKNIIKKKSASKAVVDYLFYVEKNYKLYLEIASEATKACNYEDWWWKYSLGKVYYKLGLLEESEKQLLSALKMNTTFPYLPLQLSLVYTKMDQPLRAIQCLQSCSKTNKGEIYFQIYEARVEELLQHYDRSVTLYKEVLLNDNCNFEAIACIGANHFLNNNPELALSFYKRLFELGFGSPEILNNLGLCSLFANQYDLCIICFEKALLYPEISDITSSDIWYNLACVAIYIGDLSMAKQSLKISLSFNDKNIEALNNMAILDMKEGFYEQAKNGFENACKMNEFLFEPFFNLAVIKFNQGDNEEAYKYANLSLEKDPTHFETKELLKKIKREFY
jgi:tetratricopeptide repeat protein 8